MPASSSRRVGSAGLLALVATYGIGRQAYGLFVPAFRAEFGLPLDVIGFYASAAQIGYLIATVATGVVTARYGVRVPVVLGCVVVAAGSVVVALAPGPALLALGVVLAGTSAGGTWAPFSDAVEQQVAPSGRGRALALVNAGSPVGLVVASGVVLLTGDHWRIAWWLFAAVGLAAAAVNLRVLPQHASPPGPDRRWPGLRWLLNGPSARLYAVAFAAAITSGAYFAYAADTVEAAGSPAWTGAAMWAVLGLVGAGVGVFGGGIADRYGLRCPLAAMLLLLGASLLMLFAAAYLAVALVSAAVFGIGFTTGFAFVVMWSQLVFRDRPTTGFTATIVCVAIGFSAGTGIFGVLATHFSRPVALLSLAAPALLAAMVPPDLEPRTPGATLDRRRS